MILKRVSYVNILFFSDKDLCSYVIKQLSVLSVIRKSRSVYSTEEKRRG